MKSRKRNKKRWLLSIIVCMMFGTVISAPARAETKTVEKIGTSGTESTKTGTTKTNSVSIYIGKVSRLRPASKQPVVSWKSSDPETVSVSKRGYIKGISAGKAKVRATLKDGKKESWQVTCESYKESKASVTVFYPGGKRVYKRYKMHESGDRFLSSRGCSIVGTAIAASGYGSKYTPKQIHDGSAKKKYSELYAATQLGDARLKKAGLIPGMNVCAKILENMGIKTVFRKKFTTKKAIAEIKAHVNEGNAVLFMCNDKTYKRVRVSNSMHAMLLIAVDSDGKGVFLNPYFGTINESHVKKSKPHFSFTIEKFVRAFVEPVSEKRNYTVGGGYVLVG